MNMDDMTKAFLDEKARNAALLGILGHLSERRKQLMDVLNRNKAEVKLLATEQHCLKAELFEVNKLFGNVKRYYTVRETGSHLKYDLWEDVKYDFGAEERTTEQAGSDPSRDAGEHPAPDQESTGGSSASDRAEQGTTEASSPGTTESEVPTR